MKHHYKTDAEIRDLVEQFEACSFNPADFRHHEHLTVALWYLRHYSPEVAITKMTSGIRRLAEAFGKTGYHETITLFWLRVVSDFAAGVDRESSLANAANRLIDLYDNKDLIFDYYSKERLESALAKAKWVEPDLKKLGEGFASKV